MIRVKLGREVKPGVWHYSVERFAVERRSRQPLLDACRQIERMGGDKAASVGLFRAGRSKPDLTCSVGVGAATTVNERGPNFEKWKPRDPSTFA